MCVNRGFVSGHMTGNGSPGFELACTSEGAVWRDAGAAEIATTSSPFTDLEGNWAQSQRAANDLCARAKKGYVGGHFNGHQGPAGGARALASTPY
jgi:hypothetical protein